MNVDRIEDVIRYENTFILNGFFLSVCPYIKNTVRILSILFICGLFNNAVISLDYKT
jgi:hypothetical protein